MIPELKVFFAAMTPLVELKFAIPLGLKLGLSTTSTFVFATMGTLIPSAIGLAVADPLSKFLMRNSKFIDKYFNKIFDKTRKEHTKNFERYGALFIFLFVAVPLPGSGAAMGALIAFIFGVDYWKAFFLFTMGTVVAAYLLIAGFGSIFHLLNIT